MPALETVGRMIVGSGGSSTDGYSSADGSPPHFDSLAQQMSMLSFARGQSLCHQQQQPAEALYGQHGFAQPISQYPSGGGWGLSRGASSDSGASSGGCCGAFDGSFEQSRLPGSWYFQQAPSVTGGGVFGSSTTPMSAYPAYRSSPPPALSTLNVYGAGLIRPGDNITETVHVPSSEHVAEIVGRQGCKIKALRAKTNTYIKTPVRGEEPLFVVTGRPADVAAARREIDAAADHFTQIRASRRHSQGGMPAPGQVTAYVRVPYRVVGLVVGPKGATIKRIQQDTHTYIITPSREREPVFEVTGLAPNVETARREIEQHILARTGNLPVTAAELLEPRAADLSADFRANGNDASFASHQHALRHSSTANDGCWPTPIGGQRAAASPSPPQQPFSFAPTAAYTAWSTDAADSLLIGSNHQSLFADLHVNMNKLEPLRLGATQFGTRDEGLGDSPVSCVNGGSESTTAEALLSPRSVGLASGHLLPSSIWSELNLA